MQPKYRCQTCLEWIDITEHSKARCEKCNITYVLDKETSIRLKETMAMKVIDIVHKHEELLRELKTIKGDMKRLTGAETPTEWQQSKSTLAKACYPLYEQAKENLKNFENKIFTF